MSLLDDGEVSFDANVVADFELTGSIPLLEGLLRGRMLVSDFVQTELEEGNMTFRPAQVVELFSEEDLGLFEELRRQNPCLGTGEIGAITVAKIRGAVLASNDIKTKRTAVNIGIRVSGSLGILEHAVTSGRIEPVRAVQLAEEMILAGAWFSEELIELFRAKVLI